MIKPALYTTLIAASMLAIPMVQAANISSVDCTEFSLILVFDAAVTGSTADVTKVMVAAGSAAPFTSLTSSSTISQESDRNINISLSEGDRIALGSITGGSQCTVRVVTGFTSEVTRDSSASE